MPIRRLAAAALLLLAACHDATAPDRGLAGGTYTLRRIRGEPLPWPQFPAEGDTSWVLGGTYTFRADSTYTWTYDDRYVKLDGVTLRHHEDEGEYLPVGDSLVLMYGHFAQGARRTGNTLVVHGTYEDWTYRR